LCFFIKDTASIYIKKSRFLTKIIFLLKKNFYYLNTEPELGLTISEEKIIPKKFGIFGINNNSVGIPGFRRPKFPRNSFGIPFRGKPK